MLTSLKVVNIAVEFFASNKRVAIVLRKRVIGTRFCVRSPKSCTAGVAADFADAAGALFAASAASTSSLEIRPPLPEPLTSLEDKPFSVIKRRTEGLAKSSALKASSGVAVAVALADAPALSSPIFCEPKTVSPSA